MKSASVFVGGLGDDLSREDLEREFSKYGKLNSIWVAQNPPGFAFIEYDDNEDADEAVKEMNGAVINGSRIRVEVSRNNGRGGRGRRGRGGWRDGQGSGRGFRGGRDGGFRGRGNYGSSRRGGYDSGYRGSNRFGSGGSRGRGMGGSRFNSGDRDDQYDSPSYGSMNDDYKSSNYRSRSPVGHRNGSSW